MKEIGYIETNFVSLLVSGLSRVLTVAGNQQVTRDWWARRRGDFVCLTSQETLVEAARGDAKLAGLRLAALAETDYLLTWNCRHLANAQILRRLEREAAARGWNLPKVCTPLELMGDYAYENASDS
jgi:hypothetical protein